AAYRSRSRMRADRDQGSVEKLSILRSSAMFQCQGGRARSAICLASASSFAPSACPITTIGTYHKRVTMDADFEVAHASRLRRWALSVGRWTFGDFRLSPVTYRTSFVTSLRLVALTQCKCPHRPLPRCSLPFPSFVSRLRSKLALFRESVPHVGAVAGSGTSSRYR